MKRGAAREGSAAGVKFDRSHFGVNLSVHHRGGRWSSCTGSPTLDTVHIKSSDASNVSANHDSVQCIESKISDDVMFTPKEVLEESRQQAYLSLIHI